MWVLTKDLEIVASAVEIRSDPEVNFDYFAVNPRGMTGHSRQPWELSRRSQPMELLKCVAALEARCLFVDGA